jgi:hypothetical protein
LKFYPNIPVEMCTSTLCRHLLSHDRLSFSSVDRRHGVLNKVT